MTTYVHMRRWCPCRYCRPWWWRALARAWRVLS